MLWKFVCWILKVLGAQSWAILWKDGSFGASGFPLDLAYLYSYLSEMEEVQEGLDTLQFIESLWENKEAYR